MTDRAEQTESEAAGGIHLKGWIHVGWWCWWDGDRTNPGGFRFDRPESGVSVPVYRKADDV